MLEIRKNIKREDLKSCLNAYVEEQNIYLEVYQDSISITKLDNAMKSGKEVEEVYISIKDWNNRENFLILLKNQMQILNLTVMDLFDSSNIDCDLFNFDIRNHKGVKVFSPFAKFKKIPQNKKLRISDIPKLIANKQVTGRTKMRLTDDYAFDNSVNFGEGELSIIALYDLAKDICRSSKGYWINDSKDNIIGVNLHHFDYKELHFVS